MNDSFRQDLQGASRALHRARNAERPFGRESKYPGKSVGGKNQKDASAHLVKPVQRNML